MKSDEKSSSGQSQKEKDEASIEMLRQLTRKLCSNDITTARLAAFNLSWKQEDGLAILRNILFGDFSRTTKKAAAYGLRSMRGRMRKPAIEVLELGLKNHDRTTKAACIKALALMKGEPIKKDNSGKNRRLAKPRINEIKNKNSNHNESNTRNLPR